MDSDLIAATGLKFDMSSLLAGFIFGIIGLYVFRHGKKNSYMTLVVLGLVLMIYPYFVDGAFLNWGIGSAICAWIFYNKEDFPA